MQPKHPLVALKELEETPDWACLKIKALEMESLVDINVDTATSIQELDAIPPHFLDTKLALEKVMIIIAYCHLFYFMYSRKSPPGYQALISTGDGDCLFNSVSTLLCGSEEHSHRLRLASVIHAVHHFDHYLKMVCKFGIISFTPGV